MATCTSLGLVSAANLISDTRIPISQPLLSVPPMNSCGSRKEYTYNQNVQQPCRNFFQITKARQWSPYSIRIAVDCSFIIEPQLNSKITFQTGPSSGWCGPGHSWIQWTPDNGEKSTTCLIWSSKPGVSENSDWGFTMEALVPTPYLDAIHGTLTTIKKSI